MKTLVSYIVEVPLVGLILTVSVAAVSLLACAVLAVFLVLLPITVLLKLWNIVQRKLGITPLLSHWI